MRALARLLRRLADRIDPPPRPTAGEEWGASLNRWIRASSGTGR